MYGNIYYLRIYFKIVSINITLATEWIKAETQIHQNRSYKYLQKRQGSSFFCQGTRIIQKTELLKIEFIALIVDLILILKECLHF